MRSSWHFGVGLILTALLALSGCGGGGDSNHAEIRLLNVSTGYNSLDVYVNRDDSDTDTLELEGVTYGTASAYTELESDTYAVKFKRNGVTSTLLTLSAVELTDDSHATYVASGSSGHFSTFRIDEDATDPDSGKARLTIYNASEAGSVDVYLTDETVSLEDASPFSSGTTLDAGSYRLRVTGAGDTTDLRLDVSDVSFTSRQVVSLILTATQGGVLVNALFLPQQGDLSTRANTKARVRGAVGIATGTMVNLNVGGVGLLTSATAGVIGSRYGQIDAGTAAVTLSVDGTPVAVADQTLAAGGDYTLLVWNDAGGTRTTLISDDNRVPTTSGKAKLRLLNGMSGLGAPITLAVDFSPIAEGIALGQASSATEIDNGSDYQLDVSNTNTAASLHTRSSVSLQDGSAYTMFMSGGGTMTANGTLRKDR